MFSFEDTLDASKFSRSEVIFEANFFKVIDLIIYCYSLIIKYEKPKKYSKGFHLENELTNILVEYLKTNKESFNIDNLGFEIEVGILNLDSRKVKFVDIKVTNASYYFLGKYVEDIYYAIECKRLDEYARKIKYYITGGISRFVKADYSKDMPFAVMIGYIEKGDSNVIVEKINQKLDEKLAGIETTQNLTKMSDPQLDYCYCSKHIKNDDLGKIDLYHLMLDYSGLIKS